MKKITIKHILALFLLTTAFYAQNKGITYQAVVFKPDSKSLPGVSPGTSPLVNTKVCLRFTFLDSANRTEYQETVNATTDDFGLVNATIGLAAQTGGYAKTFNGIVFNSNSKTLVVELDATAACASFEEISSQNLDSSPFARHADSAENVTGIVKIANGGTGATTAAAALKNLGLENAETTTNKSTNPALGDNDLLYPTQKAVKSYVDTKINAIGALSGVADDAVTSIKIRNGAVTAEKIAPSVLLAKQEVSNLVTTIFGNENAIDKYPSVSAVKNYTDDRLASKADLSALNGVSSTLASKASQADLTLTNDNLSAVSTTVASKASQADLDLKVSLAGDLTGTAAMPTLTDTAVLGKVLNGFVATTATALTGVAATDTVLQAITKLDNTDLLKAPIASPTLTGDVTIDGAVSKTKLQINGAVSNKVAFPSGTSTTIDFANSNLVYTATNVPIGAGGTTTFALQNLKDGGVYTLAVKGFQGATLGASSKVKFTADADLFVHNEHIKDTPTAVNKHTIFTFLVLGTDVYVSMVTGI